ncbi:ankyrin repeat domain-containing protein [Wolbachia endosymbiont (group E) of Neria commutata]|uniref:ankyrin repeat domain-containing protein n=1 Tax=Wolbachia endosymbiont (group E) of Neria commutata TaxID=3066149 RepID=UPI003132D8D4
MKNILYFVLLAAVSNLFAAERFEEEWNKKINADESVKPLYQHDNVDVRKDFKQDLPNSINQKDELESLKNDAVNVDKLNTKNQTQESESKKADDIISVEHDKNQTTTSERNISEDKKVDEDLGNSLHADEIARDLPNVIEKENLKTEPFPLIANLNENAADLQKDLQASKEIDVKDSKLSADDVSKPLEEKKEEDTAEKKVSGDFKERNGKNRARPIAKKDEDDEQSQKKSLQKWTKLHKEPIKEWNNKNVQSKSIYKRQYDSLNEHLPPTIFIDDYSKQLFYCIKKNNLSCLRGIISKLEKIGLTTEEVLKFRNKFGDTPLIYAVKHSEIDIVRFLLLQGADPRVVNNNFQSPIDIAIERKQIDIINVIAEMTPYLLEHRKISNKESSEMYDWARETKENNESQCDEDQAK